MRRIVLVLLTLALALAAAPALAAPEREATLTAGQPYTWDGGPGNGFVPEAAGGNPVRCTPIYECEDTLVQITEPGDLTAVITAGEGSEDLDVAIFASDAEGTVNADSPANQEPDQPKAEDISTNKDARATARRLTPGYYVIRVRFYAATQGVYKGTATLAVPPPAVPPAAAPTPPTPPTPAQTSKPAAKKKKASCKAKAKKIKNAKKRKAALKKCRKRKG